ncbi:MAG: replicative DNA helicase [Nitrospirae bacterium]|nr:replicative DNA helicase [Nitrospirota bacterium]
MREPSSLHNIPPQNLDAEQSVLGGILLENEAIAKALEMISAADFYKEAHRRIFNRMLDLYERNEPIDLVTLTDELTKRKELEGVGGASYLAEVVSMAPTAANIRHYCKIVREKSTLRSLITSATEIVQEAFQSPGGVDELIDTAERKIFDISEKRIRQSFVATKEIIHDTIEMVERLYDRKEMITGVPSGFRDLDEKTAGFQPGDLVIIAGRPSMGKTAVALNIAQNVAVRNKEPVGLFSLEMSKEQLVLRMLCSEAMVNSQKVRTGYVSKTDWPLLTSAAGRIFDAPIYIDDSPINTALEMRAKSRRLKMEHGLSLIIVDYLQLMKGRAGIDSREQEISDISRSLKALARELKVPVIALSQLNRAVEQRKPPKPMLSDLRESGAIEQDADVIIFVYREEVYNKDDPNLKGRAELIIGKQRNGPIGTVNLAYLEEFTTFKDYTEGD